MKTLILLLAAAALAGCGVDVATTAATAGSIKKQELEQAQKVMQREQQKVDAIMKQAQSRAEAQEANQQ